MEFRGIPWRFFFPWNFMEFLFLWSLCIAEMKEKNFSDGHSQIKPCTFYFRSFEIKLNKEPHAGRIPLHNKIQ